MFWQNIFKSILPLANSIVRLVVESDLLLDIKICVAKIIVLQYILCIIISDVFPQNLSAIKAYFEGCDYIFVLIFLYFHD